MMGLLHPGKASHPFAITLFALGLAVSLAYAGAPPAFRVLDSTPGRVTMEIKLGDLDLIPVDADGRACVLPSLAGHPMLMEKGSPQLPVIRKAILIGDQAHVAVRVIDAEYETIPAITVVPSKGHLTRDVDPARVPFEFGPVYGRSEYFPREQAILHDPFIMRDCRGVVVELRPVRYDPARGELQIARRMSVEVVSVPGRAKNPLLRQGRSRSIDPEFEPIYANAFSNWGIQGLDYNLLPEPGRCLILAADSYYDQIDALYQWELQKGIPTVRKRLSEVGANATQVKAYIQSLYDSPEGLTYIILVGDAADMPYLAGTYEGAPSDPMYVKLAGDDHYPDALISRLSAQSATQLETQIARTIRYERDPDLGQAAAWYSKACGIASNATGGTGYYDWERCNWLRDSLLAYTYVHVDQIYDPGATRLHVAAAINDGRGFVNYIGHGGTNYWTTTLFNVQDVYALTNGFMNPYICSVACLNGNFPSNECFAEAWLRAGTGAEPKGGIGMYASSTNTAWVPPCDMQTEVVRLLTNEIRCSLGGLSFNGVSKAMDLWPGSEAVRLMEQYNLFGDCTVMMRTTEPVPLTVAHAETLYVGRSSYDVATPGVAGARAALYAGGILYGASYTDGAGEATIDLIDLPPLGSQLLLTVMAYNHQTVVDTVEVVLEYLADVRIADARTEPLGPVAGVPSAIEILLANAGPDSAHDVTAILRGLGGSSIGDSVASYGHLAANTSFWGQDEYSFTPDPNLPDSAIVSLALEIRSSDYQTWHDTLQVQVFAPLFAYKDAIVRDDLGDRDGRMDHGETCDVVIGLQNVGSADAAEIVGTLTCGDPRVEVVQPIAQLTSLRSGESGYLEGTFSVRILSSVFEADIPFDLELEMSSGRHQEVELVLPVGGYLETAEYGGSWCVHEAADSVHVDQWHVSSFANMTPGGSNSWKCGARDESGYAPFNDARLVTTPLIQTAPQSVLSFWHRMEAEEDTTQPGIAFDGGIIEISIDSLAYEPLVPPGGYTHTIHDRGYGGPFSEGTACFSGTFGWTRVEIDLSSYVGSIQIRFRFGSDSTGAGAGWTLDDIEVRGLDEAAGAPEGRFLSAGLVLDPVQPNPFETDARLTLRIPREGRVQLLIVDSSGRAVRTLMDETCVPGERSVVWDGRSDAGRALPSGVYYSLLRQDGARASGRMVLVK